MKLKLIPLLVFLMVTSVLAQRKFDPQTMEQIKSKKIAFLTEQLSLTSQEAQKFWPVYNELERQRLELMKRKKDLEEQSEHMKPGQSEGDYRKMATEFASMFAREGRLIEEYNVKFLNVLPAEKVVRLYRAEGQFRAYLMHEFRRGGDNAGPKDGDRDFKGFEKKDSKVK